VVARRGGEILCAPGGGGHCAEVWDSPFAAAVHTFTGLPVAGWGVAWGLVALVLPLVARARLARRRASEAWVTATLITGISGALGVATLLGVSVRFGHICATCGLSYALVLAYAVVCFAAVRFTVPKGLARGAGLASSGLVIAFAALLVPGLRTPQNPLTAGARAISRPSQNPLAGNPDQQVAGLIRDAPPEVRQLLSDVLADYAANPVWETPPARTVIGPPGARLILTEWSDTLCSHCADLHEALVQLRELLGPDAFSLTPHYYPLDPSCNTSVTSDTSNPLRCTCARVQICAEGKPGAFELTGELFRRQKELTEPIVLELAERVVPRAELEACLRAPETELKLQSDIAWAVEHGIVGTPLLLVGGRKAIPYPPLIFALALTRGSPTNPAFATLPPPQPLPTAPAPRRQ
jgi:serine/threonine-protein kinase